MARGRHRQRYEQRRPPRLRPAAGRRVAAARDPPGVPPPRAGDRAGAGGLGRHRRSGDRRGHHAAPALRRHAHHRLRRPDRDGAAAPGGRSDGADQRASGQPGGHRPALRADHHAGAAGRRRCPHQRIPPGWPRSRPPWQHMPDGELARGARGFGPSRPGPGQVLEGNAPRSSHPIEVAHANDPPHHTVPRRGAVVVGAWLSRLARVWAPPPAPAISAPPPAQAADRHGTGRGDRRPAQGSPRSRAIPRPR